MKFPTLLEALKIIEIDPHIREAWVNRYFLHIQSVNALVAFYSQPLALWMFVACNEEGEPMMKPLHSDPKYSLENFDETKPVPWAVDCTKYNEAIDRVLFSGWESISNHGLKTIVSNTGQTITFFDEDLTIRDSESELSLEQIAIDKFVNHFDLTPTQSALT